jgi:hypothetical protein
MYWPHGKLAVVRTSGPVEMALSHCWKDGKDNQVIVVFDEYSKVSPFFMEYVLAIINEPKIRNDPNVMGVSLYSPEFWTFNITYSDDEVFKLYNSKIYKIQVPSTNGGIYFRSHWNSYQEFSEAFAGFSGKSVFSMRSNRMFRLPKHESYKKGMVNFMSFRGLYMLYMDLGGLSVVTNQGTLTISKVNKISLETPLVTENNVGEIVDIWNELEDAPVLNQLY